MYLFNLAVGYLIFLLGKVMDTFSYKLNDDIYSRIKVILF